MARLLAAAIAALALVCTSEPALASVEAEDFFSFGSTSVQADANASGGLYRHWDGNQSAWTIHSKPDVGRVTVRARGTSACGATPHVIVKDGMSNVLLDQQVTTSWADYGAQYATPPNAGLTLTQNDYTPGCPRKLEVDKVEFGAVVFADDFATPNGTNDLITNEWAYWNAPSGVQSADWEMTSGSFFSVDGLGWTGVPDATAPDADSAPNTGSWVFRMRSKASDFGNVHQEVDARINGFYGFPAQGRPAVAWDGVVIWPRYVDEFNLYFAYILRKDGRLAVTKKCEGGPDPVNGGTYYAVGPEEWETTPITTVEDQWYRIGASVKDNPDGSVTIKLYRDDEVVVEAVDPAPPNNVGHCDPHLGPARVGLRADNVDANLSNYSVSAAP